jgi:cytoplasmic tRNA 2-thiolation protein 1
LEPSTCTKCRDKPSIYYRAYSGERLCPDCFRESLRERVKRTINRFHMFEHGSRIAVGVSGGKDSLGLLRLLVEIEEETHGSEVVAVTVDEGIRGYRDEALRLVEDACSNLGVESIMLRFKDLFGATMDEIASRERELSTCSYCGVLRRRALNEAAKGVGADRLATAHTLDDMAQSVLLNILRGDTARIGTLDPGGMDLEGFVRRVKPYCEVPERESALYAYLSGFEFQRTPCPYAEEAMRNDVRGFLKDMEAKRPGTMFVTFNTGLKMMPNMRKVEAIGRCRLCGEPTPGNICRVCQLLNK